MRTLLLFGEHDLTVDPKNRLLIPAPIRKEIHPVDHGEELFFIVGKNGQLWGYPDRYYQEVVANKTTNEVLPNEEDLAFDQLNFALADKLPWDKQGRVVLPQAMIDETKLSKEITLIGVRNHIELWNKADWEARRKELVARRSEIEARVKSRQGTD